MRLTNPVLPEQAGHAPTGVRLLQQPEDLFFAETTFLHRLSSLV